MMRIRQLILFAAFSALPVSTASANTQWFYERAVIAPGQIAEVQTPSKNLSLVLKQPKTASVAIRCVEEGTAAFWNSATSGLDEQKSARFTCSRASCGAVNVTAMLPWTSTLLESELPLIDMLENVRLKLNCGGVHYGVFAGDLEAKVGDIDPTNSKEKEGKDDLDNNINFKGGAKDPQLQGANGATLHFVGGFHLGGQGTGVSDESGD
jgi:hypothetical protein